MAWRRPARARRRPRLPDNRDNIARFVVGSGCPICGFVADAQERFFAWFRIETYNQEHMLRRLRAALGFCPAHSRRLLSDEQAGDLITSVGGQLVLGAQDRLAGSGRLGRCPACENAHWAFGHALRLVLGALDDPELARAYTDGGGVCLEHLRAALPVASVEAAATMAQTLAARLADADADEPQLALLAGAASDDVERRRRLRDRLPADDAERDEPAPTTIGRLVTRLAHEACPSCLVAAQAERRYLRWVVDEHRGKPDRSLELDVGNLCAEHLRDLAVLDPSAGSWACALEVESWRGRQTELGRRLRRVPRPGPLGRARALSDGARADRSDGAFPLSRRARARAGWRAATRSRGAAREQAHEVALPLPCPGCRATETVDRRQTDLLLAALAHPAVAERYASSHGLCVRHVLALPAGDDSEVARRIVDTRLAVLAWELDERLRRYDWTFRHEPPGPELGAWRRLPPLLDGRILLGGPAEASP